MNSVPRWWPRPRSKRQATGRKRESTEAQSSLRPSTTRSSTTSTLERHPMLTFSWEATRSTEMGGSSSQLFSEMLTKTIELLRRKSLDQSSPSSSSRLEISTRQCRSPTTLSMDSLVPSSPLTPTSKPDSPSRLSQETPRSTPTSVSSTTVHLVDSRTQAWVESWVRRDSPTTSNQRLSLLIKTETSAC